jgi:hypothetical protein
VTGFTGVATNVVSTAGSGQFTFLDGTQHQESVVSSEGSLAYGPDGKRLFYTTYADILGEIDPQTGSNHLALIDNQSAPAQFTGFAFVPQGFQGAGTLVVADYGTGQLFQMTPLPGANGVVDMQFLYVPPRSSDVNSKLEGFLYVPAGTPGFAQNSMLVDEISAGEIGAYAVDAHGLPIISTERVFATVSQYPSGIAIDPATGDLLFSTEDGHLYDAHYVPEPGAIALLGLIPLALARRRRAAR